MGDITVLLHAAGRGDANAAEQLYALLYDKLRKLARSRLRGGGRDAVLDTSMVVHEGFLKMVQAGSLEATDRQQFLAYASRAMRSVVIDFVRQRNAHRRGGPIAPISLHEDAGAVDARLDDVLAVNQALERLEQLDPEAAHVVEMRYFAGLQVAEIAAALGTSESTIERRWRKARAFLFDALR